MYRVLTYISLLFVAVTPSLALGQTPIKVLFLGDNGHHKPNDRFRQLQPVFEKRGIELSYTDSAAALNAKTLSRYDGLLIYSNLTRIAPAQEVALLEYVASGKGFIPLHCASYCFLNSPAYIELVGAQFKSHGTGTFRTVNVAPEHPIMKGFAGFESFDETYVHAKHNDKDRLVLEYRVDKKGKEPWTWVRTHGKGRVFYTAWGHDERTWGNPGFQDLVERGIRWAVNVEAVTAEQAQKFRAAPEMTKVSRDVKPFEYKDAKIPFYAPKFGAKDPPTQMQLPLEVDEAMKHIVHPTDFLLKRFASDPQIKRPICMNWDERGRLWIAESVDYPNSRRPEGEGNDRIVICEDTDGDGVADKFTVFADKLSIPTSFVFAYGGIVVTQAPHTLFLRSTKGDDKADERKILFSGWGTGDTHAGPSNLRYGFDNWIYGIVGYSGFNGTVAGEKHKFGQGFFRFKLSTGDRDIRVSKLEFVRSTSNNSWGVGFSEEGLLFGSTANGNPSVFMPIPNRYYEKVRGMSASVLPTISTSNRFFPITKKVRQVDFHGGFTAAAGHALYTARTYPREYWNRVAFVAEPTGHLVASFVLDKKGATFSSKNSWNLVASDDEWCAPIMAEVGPDGNVWVIDWYNYIVQHNPTPPGFKNGKGNAYETPLRDKTHGRIYRLVMKEPHPEPKFDLKDAKPVELLAALKSDNLFWRLHAQRLIVERRNVDLQDLVGLATNGRVDDMEMNPGALHAICALHGLGKLDGDVAKELAHPSAAVRRTTVLALPHTLFTSAAIVKYKLLDDRDVQVKLAALLALADISEQGAFMSRRLIEAAQDPAFLGDRNLRDAVVMAAAADASSFLQARDAAKKPDPAYLDIVRTVAAHYAAGKNSKLDTLIASLPKAHPDYAEAVLDGVLKGLPKYREFKSDDAVARDLRELLLKTSATGKGKVIRLAKAMSVTGFDKQIETIAADLRKTIADEKQADDARLAAARQLLELQPDDAGLAGTLFNLITPRSSPTFAVGIIESLGATGTEAVGAEIIKRLPALTPQARTAGLRTLLSRPASTRQYLDAVEKGTLTLSELPLDQKQALTAHPDAKIASRAKALLAKGGGLPNADRQKVVEEFLPLIAKKGDFDKGKAVFKKHCALCHTHSGEGTKIGPDLSGVSAHTKEHLLVDILDPSRAVEGNFRVYQVVTQSGITHNGLLASETKTTIELFNSEGKKMVIQRDEIEQLTGSPKSLMPDGFEKTLKQDELIDLLEFLTTRPKLLPAPQ